MTKPIIAMTMGDPAGVGPEICVLAAHHPEVKSICRPVIIGDLARLKEALGILMRAGRLTSNHAELHSIRLQEVREEVAHDLNGSNLTDLPRESQSIPVLDLHNVPPMLPFGSIAEVAGKAAYEYVEVAVGLALNGSIDAICTAPLNKEAWKLAHVPYPGHTEALANLAGSDKYAMMLINKGLRVVHVSTHVSLKRAIATVQTKRVLETIELTFDSLRQFGIESPRIAVAGLNPHAGEGRLFGDEDEECIAPAVEQAKMKGILASGPWPPDSVYGRAAGGEFDAVIAMYHDQGHIAIKMLGMDTGVNCTIGLPLVRTSVDHGTAFDIAGRGIVREASMIEAMKVAWDFVRK